MTQFSDKYEHGSKYLAISAGGERWPLIWPQSKHLKVLGYYTFVWMLTTRQINREHAAELLITPTASSSTDDIKQGTRNE